MQIHTRISLFLHIPYASAVQFIVSPRSFFQNVSLCIFQYYISSVCHLSMTLPICAFLQSLIIFLTFYHMLKFNVICKSYPATHLQIIIKPQVLVLTLGEPHCLLLPLIPEWLCAKLFEAIKTRFSIFYYFDY